MTNFHEDKLWQASYVALMDVHEAFDAVEQDESQEIAEQLVESATNVAAKIADGLSRLDKRLGKQIMTDAIGFVAIVRTHLAVAWGRGLVDDIGFKALDDKYADLAVSLQNVR